MEIVGIIIFLEEKINSVFMKEIIRYLINLIVEIMILLEHQEEKRIIIAVRIVLDGIYYEQLFLNYNNENMKINK